MDQNEIKIEDIDIEKLKIALAQNGLDIKKLAKEAKSVKQATKNGTTNAPVKKYTPKKPEFELALANYPDFVVRRTTAKTEKLLVMMVSQQSYYIKIVRDAYGATYNEALDRYSYSTFTAGMEEIHMPEGFWFKTLNAGADEYDDMRILLDNPAIYKAIIERYFKPGGNLSVSPSDMEMYKTIPALLKHVRANDPSYTFPLNWEVLSHIQTAFGITNAKDFVDELKTSLINDGNYAGYYRVPRFFKNYKFKYASFKQYMLYDSVRMGYGDAIDDFFDEWYDVLLMQQELYGKIKDKYPKHLSEMHYQLSYKTRLQEQEIEKEKFEEHSKETKKFEASINGYLFLAPSQPEDFYDEAVAQNNCLASYVQRYADGQDHIIFMRNIKTPDVSLVTIELDLEGNLQQAYQACNRKITHEQDAVIQTWLAKTVKPALTTKAA